MEPSIASPMAHRSTCDCVARRSPYAICCKSNLNFRFAAIALEYGGQVHDSFLQYIRQSIAIRLRLVRDEFIPAIPDSFLSDLLPVLRRIIEDMTMLQRDLVQAHCVHKALDRHAEDCRRNQMEHLEIYSQMQNVQWDVEEELKKRQRRRRDTELKKTMLENYEQNIKKESDKEFAKEMAKLGVNIDQWLW